MAGVRGTDCCICTHQSITLSTRFVNAMTLLMHPFTCVPAGTLKEVAVAGVRGTDAATAAHVTLNQHFVNAMN